MLHSVFRLALCAAQLVQASNTLPEEDCFICSVAPPHILCITKTDELYVIT